MTILIRIALLMLIIYLIQRALSGQSPSDDSEKEKINIKRPPGGTKGKKSKELGEYVDYEDVNKKN